LRLIKIRKLTHSGLFVYFLDVEQA
jgi:hypothetical protein